LHDDLVKSRKKGAKSVWESIDYFLSSFCLEFSSSGVAFSFGKFWFSFLYAGGVRVVEDLFEVGIYWWI
jgi:hypothetical protein